MSSRAAALPSGEACIRGLALIGFQSLVEQSGGNAVALLDEAGISPSALTEVDRMISFRSIATLLELAAQRLDRPSLGLEWTLRTPDEFPNLGPLIMVGSLVSTYGEWIKAARDYWRFHTNAFTIELRPDEQTGLVAGRYHADSFAMPCRQLTEHIMGNVCALSRVVVGRPDENPTLVRFQHARPGDTSLHEAVFRCGVLFDQDHTEFVFDQKFLSCRTRSGLQFLRPLVSAYVRHRIARTTVYDASASMTVALAIPSIIGTGKCGLEFIAAALGVEPKTLQRRLAAEGTTFSEVLEQVRSNLARRLLIESNIPVERIAGLLDYSSTPPFTLAFKRWTGTTPLAFRKSSRERA